VGRPPWSAGGPLPAFSILFRPCVGRKEADEASAADQGVRPQLHFPKVAAAVLHSGIWTAHAADAPQSVAHGLRRRAAKWSELQMAALSRYRWRAPGHRLRYRARRRLKA